MRSSGHPVFQRPAASIPTGTMAAGRGSRPAARRTLLALLSATTLWAGATTGYLVFHDEVLARFISQQSVMQYAYEERITALRLELDRAAIQGIAARRTMEDRLADLAERQVAMEKRQALLAGLTGEPSGVPADASPTEEVAVEAARPLPSGKPFPTPDALELRMRDADAPDAVGRRSDREAGQRVARLERRLDRLAAAQARSLGGIAVRAHRNARAMRGLIARLGLDPSRFGRPATGLGGPLVPIAADPFAVVLAEVRRSVGEEEGLRRLAATLPLRHPLTETAAATSSFGPRLDPFTRGLAMHTGIDMKADQGEPARATAAGRVTVAEYSGGYGNLVEIDHGHGLATRYAHLSTLSVAPGQWVGAGTAIGRVGSTGRSTGSHLHYETRIDGEPVDPQRFLKAGSGFGVAALAGR